MGDYERTYYHDQDSFAPGVNRYIHNLEGDHVGIELEMDVDYPRSYGSILDALPNPRKPSVRPFTETDGSLSSSGGVEIVFPPIKLKSLMHGNTFFKRAITELNDKIGSNGLHEECGMHLNINVNGWEKATKDLTLLLFHYLPPEMLERVGGRELNTWCEQLGSDRPPVWFEDYRSDNEDRYYDDDDYEDDGDSWVCTDPDCDCGAW